MAIAVPLFAVGLGGLLILGEQQRAAWNAAPVVLDFDSPRPWREVRDCLLGNPTGTLAMAPVRQYPSWLGGGGAVPHRIHATSWAIDVQLLPHNPTRIIVRRPDGKLADRHRSAILRCR